MFHGSESTESLTVSRHASLAGLPCQALLHQPPLSSSSEAAWCPKGRVGHAGHEQRQALPHCSSVATAYCCRSRVQMQRACRASHTGESGHVVPHDTVSAYITESVGPDSA